MRWYANGGDMYKTVHTRVLRDRIRVRGLHLVLWDDNPYIHYIPLIFYIHGFFVSHFSIVFPHLQDKKSICNKFQQTSSVTCLTWPGGHPNEARAVPRTPWWVLGVLGCPEVMETMGE